MADTSMEGASYSALERFLIWFVIPFVFTAVLLFVLLSIFDYDIKSSIQKALHNTPVIGAVVPAPKEKSVEAGSGKAATPEENMKTKDEEITKLNARVAELQSALQKAETASEQKDQSIKDSDAKIALLEEQLKDKTQSEEEYTNQITQLASMYAKMTPSKAAPIMEAMTPKEMVLIFSMMKSDSRGAILEKMSAAKAAEASMGLKDTVPVRDREIAALQERLATNGVSTAKASTSVSKSDLGQTFANMTPKSAANVILEMNKANPDKVLAILSGMDNASRSKVMSALSDANKEIAASITAKMVQ
ncbi:hypothetical protein [Bacillus sp. 3255]|uniref:MotE family protein n=1 Tax=Bacillus sp. 3255 TaxID=2817904 RepID=UPI00285C34E0|nr:hypothetical protein [Bacillus sp. 3255]MDR6883860.1 flagellar motility protein MotE (MotC chaperone) [Bacillus sp. 3255]